MIIGHQKQWQFLEQSATSGKLAHAYLFSGQEKLGKKTIALKWLSLINDWEEAQKQHPDLILVTPEKKTIQISQIRELIWKLQLTPHSAPFKTAIIDQAHLMGWEAQSALLKTLEEPKGNAILILVTSKPEVLFPTTRSRCELVKFYPVPKSEIKKYLKKKELSEKKAELISSISRGRPGEAIDFLLNPQKLEKREKIIKDFKKALNSSLPYRFQHAKFLSQKNHLKEILEIWTSFLRESLIAKLKDSDSSKDLKVSTFSPLELKKALDSLQKINFLLSTTNINPRLALETLMLNI